MKPTLPQSITALLLLCVMAGCLLEGCADNKRQQYANVNDTFIKAVELLTVERRAGRFDDEEWNGKVMPLIRLGDGLLKTYDQASKLDLPEADNQLALLLDVLVKLETFTTQLE